MGRGFVTVRVSKIKWTEKVSRDTMTRPGLGVSKAGCTIRRKVCECWIR